MAGQWTIIVPESGTNYVLNPSAETTVNFSAHNSATVTQDLTYARFGIYAYKIVTGAVNRGVNLTLTALANAIHNVTFYARGNASNTLQVSLDSGGNYNAVAVAGGTTGGWVRYNVQIVAAQANGSTALIIRNTANETYYIDAVQVEDKTGYYTTYIDGDRGGLYRWNGVRHGSYSTRNSQERSGGREKNIETDYGVRARQMPGFGYPGVVNNYQPLAIQPGAAFQNTKIKSRLLTLILSITNTTLASFHSRRQAFMDLIKPEAYRGAQPFWLGYTGANSGATVYAPFRYAGGMEGGEITGGGNWIEGGAKVALMLESESPLWYEDQQEVAALDYQDTNAAAYGFVRRNGAWTNLGTGFNGYVGHVVQDKRLNRDYYSGGFTTANSVAVNRITYYNYNTATFVAMDGGVNGNVSVIAVAPNGDVWIGGDFTTVGTGAAATKGLARWNYSTSTWTAFNVATTVFTRITAIAIDSTGIVYVGGNFTNWDGTANSDYIAQYSTAGTWSALGTGLDNYPAEKCIVVESDTKVWLAGTFTTANSVVVNYLTYWSGTNFVSVGGLGAAANGIALRSDGVLAVVGQFTTAGGTSASRVALWNGSFFSAAGTGLNAAASCASWSGARLLVGGIFTSAGGVATTNRMALWNGTRWYQFDCALPGTPIVTNISANANGDYFIGFNTTGTATYSGLTTVTPTTSTNVFPILTITGPTTAASSCTLQWLENQTTGETLIFNQIIYTGETLTIDLSTNKKTVTSDWRGLITSQPVAGSDTASWHLHAGANTIATFITGTITGVVAQLSWPVVHMSVDGAA